MKALVGAFNQEKALLGAFFVIVQLRRLIVCSTSAVCCVSELRRPWAVGGRTDDDVGRREGCSQAGVPDQKGINSIPLVTLIYCSHNKT